eukprot:gene30322-37515_t
MYSPFQGMWALSRSQLAKWMKHAYWDRWNAMKRDTRRPGQANWNWGVPEKSNSIGVFVDPPPGFFVNSVVPFVIQSDGRPRLSNYARVDHLRNGYDVICTAEEALTY